MSMQTKRSEWVSRKYRHGMKYLKDRLERNAEGLVAYRLQAQAIRRSRNPLTAWFAEFLEETCIKDLEAERARLEDDVNQLTTVHQMLCYELAIYEGSSEVSVSGTPSPSA